MLDIKTERGQATLEQERRAVEIWHRHFPKLVYNETNKDTPAMVDAILTSNGMCRAVVETKCRDMSYDTFTEVFLHRWLVTFDKIIKAKDIAEGLQVPLLGFLYLAKSDILLWQKIWDPITGWNVSFSVDKTETQKTVNGGKALRDNVFLDMIDAPVLEIEDERQQADQ